jgi:tRNA pseudouridine32 synthase/23S rRNA pseudouridine746 synthase
MLTDEGFYRSEEHTINDMTYAIEEIEADAHYQRLKSDYQILSKSGEQRIANLRTQFNKARKERKTLRKAAKASQSESDYAVLHEAHRQVSLEQQHQIKSEQAEFADKIATLNQELSKYDDELKSLKQQRKDKSRALQRRLFNQYQFLNVKGEVKTLLDIFENRKEETPPAGAGECAAPKLLNFAFQHGLVPICMGEFWWGQPPKSEIRKHQAFYPACRGKCEPILSHMLQGLDMEENPMLRGPDSDKKITVIYEDEAMAVINKPNEFLSVPGKSIEDSVYFRMKQRYPDSKSPLIVHRLDMSTSGILLIAKTKEAHKHLQKQFLKKKIEKQYIAILDGEVNGESGVVKLPLRVDLDDRPRQLVCYEHGKYAETHWKVLGKANGETRIQFTPITGRTHQLRVHAAHQEGLNIPIKGDDLYGTKADRLHLHAAYISLDHPSTGERVSFRCDPEY